MSDILATGRIDIDLNDKDAVAGLRALDAQFDRTMRSIEGKEAEVSISGNLKELRRDLKHAEALQEGYEKKISALQEKHERLRQSKKSTAAVKQEISNFEQAKKALESQLPVYRKRAEYVEQYLVDLRQTNKELGNVAAAEKAVEGATKRATAAQTQQNKALQDYGRMQARAMVEDKRRTDAAITNERAAIRMRSEAAALDRKITRERLVGAAQEEAAVARLQARYSQLYEQHQRAERSRTKARVLFSPAATQRVQISQSRTLAEMTLLQKELQLMGAKPITQDVDLKLKEERTGAGIFAKIANVLSGTTVRVGPLTTTLAGLGKAFLLLGPIITGVVGHLGALTAAVGSGLYGAFGVASAAALGFGISLGGVGLVLPKLLNDFKNLNTLQDAYHKQVLKTGANSEKAKTKLKEFEHALGEVPPTTLKTFEAIDKLSSEWGRFTNTLRPQFYKSLAASVDLVSTRMGWFQRNTTEAFTQVTNGWNAWMKRLSSDSATGTLATLGDNANRSIKPLMSGLGNLAAAWARVAASFSRHLPGLLRGFDAWSGGIARGTEKTEALDKRVDKAVKSMRSLGHFVASLGRWLVALFAPGVKVGSDALEGYSAALDRSTASMRGAKREKIAEFFAQATTTSERFIKAMAPFGEIFFEWTTIMRPFTDVLVVMLRLLGDVMQAVLGFGPAKLAFQVAFGIFLGGKLIKSITSAGSGLWSIVRAVTALKAAGGLGAALKGGIVKFATGGLRGTTPANPLFVTQVGGLPGKGGPPVVVGKPGGGGVLSKVPGIAKIPAGAAGGFLALAGAVTAYGVALNKVATARNAEKNDAQVKKLVSERNINGIKRLQAEYEKFGKTPPPRLQKAIDEIRRLNNQDTNKLANNIKQNWDAMLSKSRVTFSQMSRFAERGMQIIHNSVRGHSQSSEKAARQNFYSARDAIRTAMRDGRVSTERGMAEIEKLWASVLKEYGFSKKQARNIAKGNALHGGTENAGTGQGAARGGLFTVGGNAAKGRAAPDNVPAMLNGRKAVVAKGEQVAVFNRHQQKAMDRTLPGGLAGFFARNKKPHYMAGGGVIGERYAGGGIVPVPGFPGESAASSVIGMITMIARKFQLILTDAFGSGHSSPGHTVTGTAADFSGPDANMNRAVSFLTSRGYLVGYDGSRGSQDWPGHGPSTRTSNYHLHVELGGKGKAFGGAGGVAGEVPTIKRVMAQAGLGSVTDLSQAALDTTRGAAQANLDAVIGSLSAETPGGGGGVGGGKAASRGQMVAWARRALAMTQGRTGIGPSMPNIEKILTLAMKESSWITDSINLWDSNAKAGNPSGGLMHVTIDKVGGSKAALFNPIKNMIASIIYQKARYGGLITHSPYAEGGIISAAKGALVGERGKELVADNNTGAIRVVDQPTIMGLNDSDSVIPAGPKGRGLMEKFAQNMGIPAFKDGKSGKQRSSKGKKLRKAVRGANPEKLPAVKRYRQLEDHEDDLNARIEVLDREVREPDDLVVKIGEDEVGNDLYGPNTAEIDRYRGEIGRLIAAQESMYGGPNSIINQLQAQFTPAMQQLAMFRDQHTRTRESLRNKVQQDQAILDIPLKGPNKRHIKRQQEQARKRIERNRNRIERENTILGEERTTRTDITEDNKDLTARRLDDARLDLADQRRIRDALSGRISEALDQSNPQAEDAAGATGETGLSYAGQRALTDTMLAQIARDYGGNFASVRPGIQQRPGPGAPGRPGGGGMQTNPALLPSGLAAAGGALGSRTAISGGSLSAGSTGISGGTISAAQGAIATAGGTGGGGGSVVGAAGAAQKVVNITNNFKTQPADPLTWTKGVEFEAGAAI
jgi:hypothetical protein